MPRYALGLDFGTASARALMVDLDGGESSSSEASYRHGIIQYPGEPAIARQDPNDYLECLAQLLSWANQQGEVVGIGIDATASTPIPVDEDNNAISRRFPNEPDALAWLWKDHSAQAEADEITAFVGHDDPRRLARVGKYYAEWFWAKALRCARHSPEVFETAETWLEQCDFLTASLTGKVTRGICAAGHKCLYYNGYPPLVQVPELARLRVSLPSTSLPCSEIAGSLTEGWGLPAGTPVAVGGVDAHLGAVGAGVAQGRLCMVLGTSACHIAVAPYSLGIASVPGISGIADDSVIPGMLGLEAGQAAFGDLLEWVSRQVDIPQGALSEQAAQAPVGANGLLTIDFHAGNRCPFADADLAGITLGQTLQTTQADIYRSAVEALAMGIRQVIDLMTSCEVAIDELLACGGVAIKNPFVLQTIADVTGKEVYLSETQETCALGAAIFGAVAAGEFESTEAAQATLCRVWDRPVIPTQAHQAPYSELFSIWSDAQSQFAAENSVIKRLLQFRSKP